MLLVLPLSIACGHITVRLVTKSTLASPIVLVAKLCWAYVLVHFLVGSLTKEEQDRNNKSNVWNSIVHLALLWFGLWVGESFCPIALTGSIATGKSTVAQMLRDNPHDNVYLIDADSIGHEILLPPSVLSAPPTQQPQDHVSSDKRYTVHPRESVYDQICTAFPDDKANFSDPDSKMIIRRKLGSVIFANDQKRRILNGITHPRIIQILVKRILYGIYLQRANICCADVPLLFESGMLRYLFCLILVVATNPDLQYQRLRQRNEDLSDQDCKNRIQSQYPMERKVAGADLVIWNNGTVAELQDRVKEAKAIVKHRLHGGLPVHLLALLVGLAKLLLLQKA